ncbi:MAG: YraN family protein [Acidocella sp. 20-61-6]|nr:MAG: YraN family protein [Acidocella sp. 20-61-6]
MCAVIPATAKKSVAGRRAAEALGRVAEDEVAARWQAKGFSVLAQRLRTGAGEIDLVLADADTLIFVEVKARKSLAEAAYAVSPRQQARLLEAASLALALHENWSRSAIRFDVALVCHGKIEHIEDAIRYN